MRAVLVVAALCLPLSLPALAGAATPTPRTGKTVVVERASGTVLVKPRGKSSFARLGKARAVPVGSTIDATRGKVRLTSTGNASGSKLQSALFFDGEFTVTQKRSSKPLTELTLAGGDFSACSAAARRSSVFPAARRGRRLWGRGRGRFRTHGRNGSASVRGTTWLTEDGCSGTKAMAREGKVTAKDDTEQQSFELEKRNEAVVFDCGLEGRDPVSSLYCVAVLSRPEEGVVGFGIATYGTTQNDYELCVTRPDATQRCESYPFDVDPSDGLKSSGVGCAPRQSGPHVVEWRIGGVFLTSLPFTGIGAGDQAICIGRPGDETTLPPGPTGSPKLRQARAAAAAGQ